jgi:hypothetical protein
MGGSHSVAKVVQKVTNNVVQKQTTNVSNGNYVDVGSNQTIKIVSNGTDWVCSLQISIVQKTAIRVVSKFDTNLISDLESGLHNEVNGKANAKAIAGFLNLSSADATSQVNQAITNTLRQTSTINVINKSSTRTQEGQGINLTFNGGSIGTAGTNCDFSDSGVQEVTSSMLASTVIQQLTKSAILNKLVAKSTAQSKTKGLGDLIDSLLAPFKELGQAIKAIVVMVIIVAVLGAVIIAIFLIIKVVKKKKTKVPAAVTSLPAAAPRLPAAAPRLPAAAPRLPAAAPRLPAAAPAAASSLPAVV